MNSRRKKENDIWQHNTHSTYTVRTAFESHTERTREILLAHAVHVHWLDSLKSEWLHNMDSHGKSTGGLCLRKAQELGKEHQEQEKRKKKEGEREIRRESTVLDQGEKNKNKKNKDASTSEKHMDKPAGSVQWARSFKWNDAEAFHPNSELNNTTPVLQVVKQYWVTEYLGNTSRSNTVTYDKQLQYQSDIMYSKPQVDCSFNANREACIPDARLISCSPNIVNKEYETGSTRNDITGCENGEERILGTAQLICVLEGLPYQQANSRDICLKLWARVYSTIMGGAANDGKQAAS